MRLIVDANIVFSGILNSNGKIGEILINSRRLFTFIAPDFLRTEIYKHHARLSKISGMSIEQVKETEFLVCRDIIFISEEILNESSWLSAIKIVEDIDPNDTPYIAFAKHFRCKIWSGDKILMRGLAKKGFSNFVTTEEIYRLRLKIL